MKYQAMKILLLTLLLTLTIHGAKSQGYLTVIKGDTVFVLTKSAAIKQANKILSFEARLSTCLSRENALNDLWDNTKQQLNTVTEVNRLNEFQITNLLEQLALRNEEKELILKQAKKERFKTLLIAGGVGIGVGAILVGVLN